MEHIVGLFADRSAAEGAVERLKTSGAAYEDHTIKEYDPSLKGWLERIFGMVEPLSAMQAEGVEHEDARWYADQMEKGRVMLLVRSEQGATTLGKILRDAGAELVRIYNFEQGRRVRTLADDIGAPAPR